MHTIHTHSPTYCGSYILYTLRRDNFQPNTKSMLLIKQRDTSSLVLTQVLHNF